jgi:GMP synthase PP-ATPase subunit
MKPGTLVSGREQEYWFQSPSATAQTRHNAGALLNDMKCELIEPLRALFKGVYFSFLHSCLSTIYLLCLSDEVRAFGHLTLVQQHLFYGPDLATQILDPVTREQIKNTMTFSTATCMHIHLTHLSCEHLSLLLKQVFF